MTPLRRSAQLLRRAGEDLLQSLQEAHPEIDFAFVIGSDWLQEKTDITAAERWRAVEGGFSWFFPGFLREKSTVGWVANDLLFLLTCVGLTIGKLENF